MDAGDARHQAISDWLEDKKPDLASTCRAAVSMLGAKSDVGHERTRNLLTCHSMREVINRLPTAALLGKVAASRDEVDGYVPASDQVRTHHHGVHNERMER